MEIRCRPLNLTCLTQNLETLRWFFNGQLSIAYVFIPNQALPTMIYDQNGININVTRASALSSMTDEFNGTSVLTTTTLALSMQNITSIQCGTNSVRSSNFMFNLDVDGMCVKYTFAYPLIVNSIELVSFSTRFSFCW